MQIDWYYLEKSIATCSLSPEEKDRITNRLVVICNADDEFSSDEREELIKRVRENQVDKIIAGMNYNQTDILNHLKKLK